MNFSSERRESATAVPPKPPDDRQFSFRDKLVGAPVPVPRRETIDLIGKQLAKIDLEEGDRLRPHCYIDDSVVVERRKKYQEAIIVKLLGKDLGFFTMRDRLKGIWKLTGGFDMVDVGYGFYIIQFDMAADREKVISGGPWMVFDHCLAVQPWKPNFIASQVSIDKTLVWVRIPNLGMEYYDESILLALAAAIGTPLRWIFKLLMQPGGNMLGCVLLKLGLIFLWLGGFGSKITGLTLSMRGYTCFAPSVVCMVMWGAIVM
jgi:hypothetical protein